MIISHTRSHYPLINISSSILFFDEMSVAIWTAIFVSIFVVVFLLIMRKMNEEKTEEIA
jgi:hypothetical protein